MKRVNASANIGKKNLAAPALTFANKDKNMILQLRNVLIVRRISIR